MMKRAGKIILLAACLLAGHAWATNSPAATDTNFIDPALTGDSQQVKELAEKLTKELGTGGVKPGGLIDEQFLYASLLWGAVSSGYILFSWRQRAIAPFIGGMVMMGASIFVGSWFWMSVVCLVTMVATHWLARQID